MLVNAERNDGVIETLSGMAAVDWLVPHYRRMMAEKGFTGVSPALLYGLCRNGRREDALLLLRLRDASAERSPVAAVLFARHGSAATYLVGWNTEAGRKVRANHLLLWQGMLELRQRGCGWLDLGGIDDVSTPGVASFKRGVKGQEYRLIGECLAV